MIVVPDDQASKQPSDQKVLDEDLKMAPEEPPPSYTLPVESMASTSSSPPPAFKTKPTNFLALSTGGGKIHGEFVIDPDMRIPTSMLPPLSEGETEDDRKNLSLSSKHSSVHAEIWLLSPSRSEVHKPRRTTIALNSDHGSIRTEVHTLDGAAPFSLVAHAANGSVRVALPGSFQGLMSISTRHGSISISDTLVQNATQLSQLGDMRHYFVGDFQKLGPEGQWDGDQVEINAPHGSIRLKYMDEITEAHGKKGLLSRLFGK